MAMASRDKRRGNTLVEFTLVGIPVIFLLISIFEMARGMWLYHTLAYSVREGTRFAVVHGNNCNVYPSNCAVTIRQISERIRRTAVGFVPEEMQNLEFISQSRGTFTCATLAECLGEGGAGDTYWPAGPPGSTMSDFPDGQQFKWLEIRAQYPFRTAIAMFWPGVGSGQNFGVFMLPASSRDRIQY